MDVWMQTQAQRVLQLWETEWAPRFGREPDPHDLGFGYTVDQLAAFTLPETAILLGYAEATHASAHRYLDGLDDAIENALALRFAPVLYLHRQESYYPATPTWFMDRVHMRYNHNNCSDDQILDLGQVNNVTIGQQRHRDKNFVCSHSGDENLSSGGTTTSRL